MKMTKAQRKKYELAFAQFLIESNSVIVKPKKKVTKKILLEQRTKMRQ